MKVDLSYMYSHLKHVLNVLHRIYALYHEVVRVYMPFQNPCHHILMLFFLRNELLLNNAFPMDLDLIGVHHGLTRLLLFLLVT